MALPGRAAATILPTISAPTRALLDGPSASLKTPRPLRAPTAKQTSKAAAQTAASGPTFLWLRNGVPMAVYKNAPTVDQAPVAMYKNAPAVDLARPFSAASEGSQSFLVAGNVSAPPKLLHVAVDVDEVLGSFLSTLNTFMAEEYMLHHKLAEYHVYDFMKIWKCSQTEANDRVHAFFDSEHFNYGIHPIPGAYQALLQLASYCHLVVVTSRQYVIREPTLDWIEQHYSGVFKEVHFGNHFALEGKARPKSEICRSLGVEILIDDNPRYALECAEHGIEVLLFDLHGSYPWSKTPQGPTHPLITRVHNWGEVGRALRARRLR